MEHNFAESLANQSHVVLGRRLHDYCLYDAMLLELDSNPLYSKARAVTLEDLAAAVLICSTPPSRLLSGNPATNKWARRWWMFRVARAIHSGRTTLELEVKKFETYIADFDARPKFWEESSDGEGLRAPWILSLVTFIEDHSNKTEHEIMSAPIGQILWRAAALAEQLGMTRSQILTDEEQTAMKEMGLDV